MSMQASGFKSFLEYVSKYITGDENGEAQVFLDRFFQALGYPGGFKGAGANCEFRIRNEESRSTRFADLFSRKVRKKIYINSLYFASFASLREKCISK